MAAHQVGVAHRAQVGSARQGGLVAFGHGREPAVRRLPPGHVLTSCAPLCDFGGEPVQALVAPAIVTGDAPFERASGGRAGRVREAARDDVAAPAVWPPPGEPTFVKDPRHGGLALRQGRLVLAPEGRGRIARAMGLRAR